MDKSKKRAYEILEQHIKNVEKTGKAIVRSVILVGSLSDDSYTGNAGSDIDLIHVLYDCAPQNSRYIIQNLINQTESETGNEIPISKCIYRYSDLLKPYPIQFELCKDNKDYFDLPIEVFRIKDSGITAWGEDIIRIIDTPTKDDVMQFKKLSVMWNEKLAAEEPAWNSEYLEICEKPTLRILTQIVITSAMLDYYFATGKTCSSKAKIALIVREFVPFYKFQRLLDISTKWRYSPQDITPEEEEIMHSEYQVWRNERKGKEIDFVPLKK